MRLVVDSNVIYSALIGRGPSWRILKAVEGGACAALTTDALLNDLYGALVRPSMSERLRVFGTTAEEIIARIRSVSEPVTPAQVDEGAVRDPDDAAVLACAVGGSADIIVTGDKDLLVLREYQGIAIMSPVDCLRTLGLE